MKLPVLLIKRMDWTLISYKMILYFTELSANACPMFHFHHVSMKYVICVCSMKKYFYILYTEGKKSQFILRRKKTIEKNNNEDKYLITEKLQVM